MALPNTRKSGGALSFAAAALCCVLALLLAGAAPISAQLATSVDGEVVVVATEAYSGRNEPRQAPAEGEPATASVVVDGAGIRSSLSGPGLLPGVTYFRLEETQRDEPFFYRASKSKHGSSLTCYGTEVDWRSCEFTNMCFDHEKGHYEFYVADSEERAKWKRDMPGPCLFTENSMDGIYIAHVVPTVEDFPSDGEWPGVLDEPEEPPVNADIRIESAFTFIVRIHQDTYNMYHTIHDDILPTFHLFSFHRPTVEEHFGTPYNHSGHLSAIDRRMRIAHVDWTIPHKHESVLHLHSLFSDFPVREGGRNGARLPHHFGRKKTCYKHGVVGKVFNSRALSPGWFNSPEVYPHANGIWMRMAADYLLTEMDLPRNVFVDVPSTTMVERERVSDEGKHLLTAEQEKAFDDWSDLPLCSAAHPCNVCYLQRTYSRRILNEREVFERLLSLDKVDQLFILDEMQMEFTDMVATVRYCDVLLGNHGAGLSLAIFMPRGATVIELVAFGVQQENFNYFGAMYDIPGSGLNYVMYQNDDGKRSFRPTTGRAATKDKGVLGLPKSDLIDCLEMPIMQKPYTWASKCLHYWKDFETVLDLDEIGPKILASARRTQR
eukprot:TRINITY_DN5550_c0_g1_i2.p1 TRINITY_DN5550_c0_g1~~TRINITY_DN5550_c0_g1_i2.p1  ORF type:complete len:606 (+),score=121.76 TRINITY_DN5550_c0_g1_i2:91-1908(+)